MLILFGLVNVTGSLAQFQVATIKPSTGTGSSFVSMRPRELIVKNTTLRFLIRMAHQVRDFQVTGGPAWMNSERYDVTIKMEVDWPKESREKMLGLVLQALLKERFKLIVHRETKELPIYSLTVSKYGLRLPRSKGNCTHFEWGRYAGAPGKQSPDYCGAVEAGPNLRLNHTLDAVGMSLGGASGLTTVLSRELDRDVIDNTSITRLFDIHLEWNREATARSMGPQGRIDLSKLPPSMDDESPSIFTAVEDQLGLKLDSYQGPVEIIVVDRAEKPEN